MAAGPERPDETGHRLVEPLENGGGGPTPARSRRLPRRADNPLAVGVARVPAPIRRKLIVAFAAMVVLLVAIGALGLRGLGQSNDRVRTLGMLQQRVAAYRGLQIDNNQLRQMRSQRSSEIPAAFPGTIWMLDSIASFGGAVIFTS